MAGQQMQAADGELDIPPIPLSATQAVPVPARHAARVGLDMERLAPAARIAGTTVLCLAPFLFALGLKPFAYGIWYQAEPVSVGLLVLGAASVLCLLALDLTGHAVWEVLRQPPLLSLLALVGWSALVCPLQSFPARSWFGTPELGEGIFAFLALAALMALGWALWPYRHCRVAMAGAATAGALVIGGLNAALPPGSSWRPELLGAYGGLVGPAVVLIILGAARRPAARLAGLAFLAAFPAVLFSHSKVALLLDCVAGPLGCWLLVRYQARWRPAVRRRALALGPLAAVAIFALIVIVGMVMPPINVYAFIPHRLADRILHFVSAGPTGIDVFYSVRSRGFLAMAGFAGLMTHPLAWLWGFGWGSYADVLYRHTFIPGVKGFQYGIWAPNWEGVGAGAFHVHSDPLEALFSTGLIGAALYMLFLCAIIRRSRRAMLPYAAVGWFIIAGLLSEWYPDLLVYPFLAVAVAAGCAPLTVQPRRSVLRSPRHPILAQRDPILAQRDPILAQRDPILAPRDPILAQRGRALARRGVPLAVAVLLAFGARATASDALAGGRLLAALNRQAPQDVRLVGGLPADYGRGGVHLWWAALNYVYFIDSRLAHGQKPTPAQAAIYARLLEEVDSWTAKGRAGIRLAALTVAMRNDLVANQADTTLSWLRQSELPHWNDAVVNLIRRAPHRTDVAVPDLAWLVAGHHYAAVLGLCGRIFSIDPGDRVCLWYTGVALLTDRLTQETAFQDLRAALARDVAAVVPVTPAARQAVESHFAAQRPLPRAGGAKGG
jgi:hypothetical protein